MLGHNYTANRIVARLRVLARLVFVVSLTAVSQQAVSQQTIYVDIDADGNDDGSSWASAFVNLQDALATARRGDELWVAEGIYLPDRGEGATAGDRTAKFYIAEPIALYGGFAGVETERSQRDWKANETVLSGDLLQNDSGSVSGDEPSRADNSSGIIEFSSSVLDGPQVLDGFTVSGSQGTEFLGSAIWAFGEVILGNLHVSHNYASKYGGGLKIGTFDQCPTLFATTFVGNVAGDRGGALYTSCQGGELRDLVFINNRAHQGGAVLTANSGNIAIFNAHFSGNEAGEGGAVYTAESTRLYLQNTVAVGNQGDFGGAFFAEDNAAIVLVNSIVAFNTATVGGAMVSLHSRLRIYNSVVALNEATEHAGAIRDWGAKAQPVDIRNSIVWGNTVAGAVDQFEQIPLGGSPGPFTVSSSVVDGALPAFVLDDSKTITSDPLFVDVDGDDNIAGTIDDNFRLQPGSPGIDAGDNAAVPHDSLDVDRDFDVLEPVPIDLAVNDRFFGAGGGQARVDIGAYEFGAPQVELAIAARREEHPVRNLTLYPNPATSIVVFDARDIVGRGVSSHEVILQIFDSIGRLVQSDELNAGLTTRRVDVSRLATGLYFVSVRSRSSIPVAVGSIVVLREVP